MASNINPSLTPTNSLDNFRFWCQKVLPLVYDDSLSYYEVLGKMVVQLNDVIDNVNADTENVLTLKDAFLELQTYVNNFFADIDQLASYVERAETAQTAANASAINAAESASNASASSLAAMNARDTAVAARQAAQASANNASTAATNATNKANEAAQSAITAQTAQASASNSATLASTDRSAAQTAASTATTKANEASESASNAQTSATNAEQSKADAEELVNNIQENLDNIQQNTEDITDLNWNKASAIYENSSGEIASFNDGSKNSPVKITEISDNATKIFVFGYNLLLNEAQSGRYGGTDITINNDGTFTVTNKTGAAWDNLPINTTPILLKAGTYTIAEYDGEQMNQNSALNIFSGSTNILNTRYTKVNKLVLTQDTEITVTFSVAYGIINEPIYAIIAKGSIDETGITYHNIPQIYKKSVGIIVPPNTEIFSQDGVNNIWADNGQISVEYVANTKMYIDNKIAELQATLLENIGG